MEPTDRHASPEGGTRVSFLKKIDARTRRQKLDDLTRMSQDMPGGYR